MVRISAGPCSTGHPVPNTHWRRWSSLVGAFAAVTVLGASWYCCSDIATRALLAVVVVLAVPGRVRGDHARNPHRDRAPCL